MKKTLFAISAIAVLLGFTACTSDEIVEPQVSDKTITISASTESNATRTALADDGEGGYDVVWSTGDVITIGDKTFTLSSTPGTTKGTFTGKDPANGKFDVWYGISSASLPAMQTYKAGEITNSPMHASVDITDGVASIVDFKNLCGLFKLSLKGTATVKSITISANEPVAGEFTVGTDGGAVLEESADDKSITLDCGDGVTLTESATDFFIAMPAGTYTGVSITLTDDAGKVCVKKLSSTKNLVITRSNITPASFTASTFMPTITASSPVGTIGMLDGREGIVVDFGGSIGKVVVATMNVGATSVDYATAADNATCYGVQYNAQDASDPSKMGLADGWRAPKQAELKALYELSGGAWSAADYDNHKAAGYVWTIGTGENQNTLFLPAAGYGNAYQRG
ncbi:MAG: hypothetical protein MJZ60_11040, partial [Bacteroidaceae bacterium]|nr:hypothetical protein [Bacteroidaceae bacterium]